MRLLRRIAMVVLSVIVVAALLLAAGAGALAWRHQGIASRTPSLQTPALPGNIGKWVDPFIGTGGWPWMSANSFPGVCAPFGMVRLSPDTVHWLTGEEALNKSGYWYGDDRLLGFSHTRLVGTGAVDGGHFLVTPAADPIEPAVPREARALYFSNENEKAFPGYYAVRLDEPGVLAELTATRRVGVHRYTFDPGVRPRLRIDVANALGDRPAEDGWVRVAEDGRVVQGHARTFGSFSGRYGGSKAWFHAELSEPVEEHGFWSEAQVIRGEAEASGNDLGVELTFAQRPAQRAIELRLAISFVSLANAQANAAAETGGKPFGTVLREAKDAWEEVLGRIDIEGGAETQRRIFYTALYRCFQMPTIYTDVNGEYRGFDQEVHQAQGFDYYTDMSLWDTFRTTHPLYTLIAPGGHVDMIRSLIAMSEQGGYLPRWPSGHGYTNSMLGTPADIVIADAYLKGLRGFDAGRAYQKMTLTATAPVPREHAFSGREGVDYYLDLGYCAADRMSEAVARTTEFAWADTAIANLAEALGHDGDAAMFRAQSKNYANTFNPATDFFQPRMASGTWQEPFDRKLLTYWDFEGELTNDYVEGSAWQWRFPAPYDADGLVSLFDSPEQFARELNTFFEEAPEGLGRWSPNAYYWHGNQPSIHTAYLFNAAGRPDLTQKWVRWVLDTKHGANPVGLDGNDDGGTLSAWYVWSALGLYPVAGTSRYEIGAPLFEKAVVDMGAHDLTIIAENYAPGRMYAAEVYVNGEKLDGWQLEHGAIAEGGEIRFVMADAWK